MEMAASIVRNARKEDLVMAAFDDMDRVDLHVAQVLYSSERRFGSATERCWGIECLSVQPETSGFGFGEVYRLLVILDIRERLRDARTLCIQSCEKELRAAFLLLGEAVAFWCADSYARNALIALQ
jgi:hypothetical protein